MEQAIIDIIDSKAAKQYEQLPPIKRMSYRAMLYAGAQVNVFGHTMVQTAAELGHSKGSVSHLVQKWIDLMREGDLTVNRIITAFHKLYPQTISLHKREMEKMQEKQARAELREEEYKSTLKELSQIPVKPRKVLGFIISPEDERKAVSAINASIAFFQTYGKGCQPRMNGEYYTPGTRPAYNDEDKSKWLPLEAAALYCGCKPETIRAAGLNGTIDRRLYKRNSKRCYYEYSLVDLDEYIRNRREHPHGTAHSDADNTEGCDD